MKNPSAATKPARKKVSRRNGEPTWEIAYLYPTQGNWSVEEYLDLPGNRLIEYSEGRLEVLPMPVILHQWIALFLYRKLEAFAGTTLGLVLAAPFSVRLWPEKFREPDVGLMLAEHRRRVHQEYWDRADLVMEVVSDDPESRQRDLVTKRAEYARARIPEYWIVDPKRKEITVLGLEGKNYIVRGTYRPGDQARSHLLPDFAVDVTEVFAGPK